MIESLKAVIMGIVEGATEFLPVSSTGHLLVAGELLNFTPPAHVFEVVIQGGAILAIVLLYFKKLWDTLIGLPKEQKAQRFALNVAIAFAPAVLLGMLLHDVIKSYLFSPMVVAVSLIVGGVIMLWVEKKQPAATVHTLDDLSPITALKIGLCQCAAMIPGVSRSGATLVGGLLLGVDRKVAAEFSFFLAIPTICGAAVLDLLKAGDSLQGSDYQLIAIGFVAAFLSALVVIKAFIHFISRHGLQAFAYYRIVAGAALIGYLSL